MVAPESVIAWIVIGAIAGWLAGLIVKGYGFGLIGNIVVGILGAAIAGFLVPRLGISTASTVGNIIAATIGAIILLLLVGLFRLLETGSLNPFPLIRDWFTAGALSRDLTTPDPPLLVCDRVASLPATLGSSG